MVGLCSCCMLFALWIVGQNYSAGHPKILATRKAPAPKRFFSKDSHVIDLYVGDDSDASQLLAGNEAIFVMYYAPWSSDCMRIRWEFERLAKYYDGNIKFYGINCWNPKGDCRRNFKMYTYPVFALYIGGLIDGGTTAILYNDMPKADYMYRFLKESTEPLSILHTKDEVEDFFTLKDASMLAFYDFYGYSRLKKDPAGYRSFHMASLRALEMDFDRSRVQFGVIIDRDLAEEYNMTYSGEMRLYQLRYLENVTSYLPWINGWKSRSIITWLFANLNDTVRWISSTGYRSEELDELLGLGSAFILFAPRVPLLDASDLFSKVREVILDYLNCNRSSTLDRAIQASRRQRFTSSINYYKLSSMCHDNVSVQHADRYIHRCCQQIVLSDSPGYLHRNVCDYSSVHKASSWRIPLQHPLSMVPALQVLDSSIDELHNDLPPIAEDTARYGGYPLSSETPDCTDVTASVPFSDLVEYCCDTPISSRLPPFSPTRYSSPKIRLKGALQEVMHCDAACINEESEAQKYQQENGEVDAEGSTLSQDDVHSGGARRSVCGKLSLAKLSEYDVKPSRWPRRDLSSNGRKVRPEMYSKKAFRRSLNENVHRKQPLWSSSTVDITGMWCTSNQTLSFIAMDSMTHIEFAIRLGIIDPARVASSVANWSAVVVFNSETESIHLLQEPITTKSLSAFLQRFVHRRLEKRFLRSEMRGDSYDTSSAHEACAQDPDRFICLRKVTTKSLVQTVMDPRRDVILLYYTAWCGACKAVYATFLTLMYYFHGTPDIVFAHIDAGVNDLPWEFTVDRYPAIVFFPKGRKAESSAFPTELPMTLPNLIAFVLASADAKLRASFALTVCGRACRQRNRQKAVMRLRLLRHHIASIRRRLVMAEQQIATMSQGPPGYSDDERTFTDSRDNSDNHEAFMQIYIRRTQVLLHRKQLERKGVRALLTALNQRDLVGDRIRSISHEGEEYDLVEGLLHWGHNI